MTRTLLLTGVVAILAAVAAGSATPVSSACRPTLSQGGGPFGTNNTPAPRRARIGSGHVLTGRILRYPGCGPVKGAVVEFWQASPKYVYDRRGHGSVVTGPTGSFRFEGPVPAIESGRPPHIHVKVIAAGYEEFVATYFLARGERLGRMTIVLVSAL